MDYAIKFSGVHKKYIRGDVVCDINLIIKKGEFVFLRGETGFGKTTLLKLIIASERPTKGNVFVNGINLSSITKKKLIELRQKIGFVFQDFKLIDRLSLFDNIALPLTIKGYGKKKIETRVTDILSILKLTHKRKLYPNTLSEGEKQKIAFARAIVGDQKIILADEPTASLCKREAKKIIDLLSLLNKSGTTVLFATKNSDIIQNTKKRVIFLKRENNYSTTIK